MHVIYIQFLIYYDLPCENAILENAVQYFRVSSDTKTYTFIHI